jgi:hypothetical protein
MPFVIVKKIRLFMMAWIAEIVAVIDVGKGRIAKPFATIALAQYAQTAHAEIKYTYEQDYEAMIPLHEILHKKSTTEVPH